MTADAGTAYALDGARRAFLDHVDEQRLRLYRTMLQAGVRHASPIALSFASHLGMSLDDVMRLMTPPSFWPPSDGPVLPPQARWDLSLQKDRWGRQRDMDSLHWRLRRGGGFAHRVSGGGDFIGWKVVGDTVEAAMRFGEAAAMTRRGTLRLWLPGVLPETIVAALPGRPLRALVDHPVLGSGDWRIAAVADAAAGGHVLRVKTGQRLFAGPWPNLLAGLMLSHGAPDLAARYARDA